MRDFEIRSALVAFLQQHHAHDPDTTVLNEMGLCEGLARIDVAVINGQIHGFEIKSPRDTLNRLASQEAVYSRTLDLVTIVSHAEHLPRVRVLVPAGGAWQKRGRVKWVT